MSLLSLNQTANAQTATQIAFSDLQSFNSIATVVYTRLREGIAGQEEVVDPISKQVRVPAKAAISADDYKKGVAAAIGVEAAAKLAAAAAILDGTAQ